MLEHTSIYVEGLLNYFEILRDGFYILTYRVQLFSHVVANLLRLVYTPVLIDVHDAHLCIDS